MAKQKPKQPKRSLIADLLAEKPSPTANIRRENTTEKKQYFLIVCEGEKTEPNYFKSIQKELPEHLVELEISGVGYNTVSLIEKAIQKREERKKEKLLPDFDKVYTVFDKDDFSDEQFNQAIFSAEKENIHPSFSNEAFELWYVLHFQFLNTGISRKAYIDILKKHLGKYEKNQVDIYAQINEKGDENQAIKWAEKLLSNETKTNPAKTNPCTRVHELISELNKFK